MAVAGLPALVLLEQDRADEGICCIEPGSPWENPLVESFNGRARDELLNIEEFATLAEAIVFVEGCGIEYNTYLPRSPPGCLTPAEVARQWTEQHQPSLP